MNNKFELKDGHAFICGYIQEVYTPTKHILMYLDGDYQIEVYDVNNPYNRLDSKSFDYNLTAARKYFKEHLTIV